MRWIHLKNKLNVFLPIAKYCEIILIKLRSCDSWNHINTLRLRLDGRHFPYDIFKCIFLNENV